MGSEKSYLDIGLPFSLHLAPNPNGTKRVGRCQHTTYPSPYVTSVETKKASLDVRLLQLWWQVVFLNTQLEVDKALPHELLPPAPLSKVSPLGGQQEGLNLSHQDSVDKDSAPDLLGRVCHPC